MKIMLLNDTATAPHVGCQAVSDAHARMLGRKGHEVTVRYFLGELATFGQLDEASAIDAIMRDERLASELQSVDAVVLNGEGTIHRANGQQWLAMLGAAQKLRKPTLLVNAVLEDTRAYGSVFEAVDDLVVRDARSAAFAKSKGWKKCRIVPDSCIEARYSETPLKLGAARTLVTDWHADRDADVGASCVSLLREPDTSAVFLPFHSAETKPLWRQVPATLREYGMVVTARHHGVHLAILASRPFVALPSNTQKIEGFLEYIGAPFGVVTSKGEVLERMRWAENNEDVFDKLSEKLRAHLPLDTFACLGGEPDPLGEEREVGRLAELMTRRDDFAADAEWSLAAGSRRFVTALRVGEDVAPDPNARRVARLAARLRQVLNVDAKATNDALCEEILRRTPDERRRLLIASRLCAGLGNYRRAYVALDRFINLGGGDDRGWFGLLRILPDADDDLAYWIGLKATWARRADVTASASALLIGKGDQPHRVLEILPTADWTSTDAAAFWATLRDRTSALALSRTAEGLRQLGRSAPTERLLRLALEKAPSRLDISLDLTSLLEEQFRYVEALAVASDLLRLRPRASEALLTVARLHRQLDHHKEAAQVLTGLLEAQPENPRVWLECGRLARASVGGVPYTAEEAYFQVGRLSGGDPNLLRQAARFFYSEGNFSKAAEYFEKLRAVGDSSQDLPGEREEAISLREVGRTQDATATFQNVISRSRRNVLRATGEEWELHKREEALSLCDVGRGGEAEVVLRALANTAGPPNYARAEYLPGSSKRLERLRDIVATRDLVAFLQGPSFSDCLPRLREIADADVATATLGSFPPVEKALSSELGRGVDLLLLTPPGRVRSWYPELCRFLERPTPTMLVTSRHALATLPELGVELSAFIERYDERLLWVYPAGGPPLPSRPLHFEHGNSLALLLPLLVLSRPKRIFLVGADGGAHPERKRPYFFYPDVDADKQDAEFASRQGMPSFANRPDLLEEANRRWRVEAADSDRIMDSALRHLSILFGVPVPPIYNVCPHSAHGAFEKIAIDEAVDIIRRGGKVDR